MPDSVSVSAPKGKAGQAKRAIKATRRGKGMSVKPNTEARTENDAARKALAARARAAAAAITEEEDATVIAAAMSDPDAPPNTFIGKRRGRPKAANPKELVTLRIDPEALEFFRARGEGWQTRINDALRKAAGLN